MTNLFYIIKKKILRLKGSKNVMKLNFLFHRLFGEKDIGSVGFNFDDKPSRTQIIQETINRKKYNSYLEIGCFNDDLFNKIKCKNKVGVDPYSGGTIRKTSDDFFTFNNDKFDCVFIDGLHLYQQVRKDIYNSIKVLNDNGIIFIHDCLPNTVYDQAIPRSQYNWNGNVWKAIVEARTLDHIDTYTCYADMGIGIIIKRKNLNKLEIIESNFENLKFSDYFENHKKFMNIINYNELNNLF